MDHSTTPAEPSTPSAGDAELEALLAQAVALHQQQHWSAAAQAYQAILVRAPRHFKVWRLAALLHFQQGDFDSAIRHLHSALEIEPNHASVYLMLGNAEQGRGRSEAALASYEHAIQLQPGYVEAHYNRALALQTLQRLDEALDAYRQTLQLAPAYVDAYCDIGVVLQTQGSVEAALASYQRALELDPDHLRTLYNLGHALHHSGRPAEALPHYDRALQLKPDYLEALCNYGQSLQTLHQFEGAMACYTRAVQLQPKLAIGHWNLGLCHLLHGNFTLGWLKYEWGWAAGQRGPRRLFSQPLWLGDAPLAGKRIVLHAEQGLGDTLQFCRYAPLVAALGAQVWLEVQAPLLTLLARLPGMAGVYAQGETPPEADYHCPLMSLPLALRTQLDTIPGQTAYLQADPAKRAKWAARLADCKRPRIGLAWSGNPTHTHDAQRSIPLAYLAPLMDKDICWVRLQTDLRERDQALLQELKLLDFTAEMHDMDDTAALLVNLDRVIAVDTSIAHLAGALGIPTTVLLPYVPDFRWLLERSDSPWYASLSVLRQTTPGDWHEVIQRIVL